MSSFACNVVRVEIHPHPNADMIEIAKVGDFQCIVRKGDFKTGDLAVYIPEQAIVPNWMLEAMSLKGKLYGSAKNRVKAIKLRGVLSQGLLWPVHTVWYTTDMTHFDGYRVVNNEKEDWIRVTEGDDVADFLGIVKYEPVVPAHFAGRAIEVDFEATIKYDFDNIKKTPDLFDESIQVVITEKIHGTFMMIGIMPERLANDRFYERRVCISSKGLAARGVVLDHNDEGNVYAKVARQKLGSLTLLDRVLLLYGHLANVLDQPIFVLGEVFGRDGATSIQDLTYGADSLQFRVFDIAFGTRGTESYMSWDKVMSDMKHIDVPTVPTLYIGPYNKEILLKLTDGPETVSGTNSHMREGVVVKSFYHEPHPRYGRRIAKSVSEAYLLRKEGEVTEYQ